MHGERWDVIGEWSLDVCSHAVGYAAVVWKQYSHVWSVVRSHLGMMRWIWALADWVVISDSGSHLTTTQRMFLCT